MFFGLLIQILYNETIQYPQRITFLSITFHSCILLFLLFPLLRFGNILKIENVKISIKVLNHFSIYIIIPSLVSIFISLSTISLIFRMADMHAARQLFLDGSLEGSFVTMLGPLGYVISLGKCCSSIALVLAFYRIFYLKNKGIISILLLISSLCYPLFSLSFAGRDGLLRWGLLLIFNLILFKKYISFKSNRKMWLGLGCIGICFLFILGKITYDRFKNTEGVTYSVLRYIGEPYYIFSYGFHRFGENPMKDNIFAPFPIITQDKSENTNLNDTYSADYYLNTFSTIAGSILMKIGAYRTFLLFMILFLILFQIYGKYNRPICISFTKFIGFIIYYEVCLTGVFYYMYDDRFVQAGIIFYIVLAYIIDRTGYKSSHRKLFKTT